eukprot:TRINITY_DN3638_c0_g1_i8.p1 TRINITY_DN3638_c0_g1~~TRINITY_DN3638_c0_g1_i8.p1  ORF type:complete len:720 (-),score=99.74 TRINITY_DN3638_c0_g1_i8:249-2354(-)
MSCRCFKLDTGTEGGEPNEEARNVSDQILFFRIPYSRTGIFPLRFKDTRVEEDFFQHRKKRMCSIVRTSACLCLFITTAFVTLDFFHPSGWAFTNKAPHELVGKGKCLAPEDDTIVTPLKESDDKCMMFCSGNPSCTGYDFDTEASLCSLHYARIIGTSGNITHAHAAATCWRKSGEAVEVVDHLHLWAPRIPLAIFALLCLLALCARQRRCCEAVTSAVFILFCMLMPPSTRFRMHMLITGETPTGCIECDSHLISTFACVITSFMILLPVRCKFSIASALLAPFIYLASMAALPIGTFEGDWVHRLGLFARLLMLSLVSIGGRAMIESQERVVFLQMGEIRRALTHEKVLRCAAEHEAEVGPFSSRRRSLPSEGNQEVEASAHGSRDSTSIQPHSAPAAVCIGNSRSLECHLSGDCVPEDYLVQTSQTSVPQKIKDVSVGQEVLCYDLIMGSPCFVELTGTELSERQPPSKLVLVTLEDGTVMEMTPDHPVSVGAGIESQKQVHAAGKLQAGFHSLTCLKAVELTVKDVQEITNKATSPVVSLYVQNASRYNILMSPPRDLSFGSPLVALGAANATQQTIRWKGTFLDIDFESEASSLHEARLQKANSWHYLTEIPLPPVPPVPAVPRVEGVHNCARALRGDICRICRFWTKGKQGFGPGCSKGVNCDLCHHERLGQRPPSLPVRPGTVPEQAASQVAL